MTVIQFFPYLIALLNFCAGSIYCWNQEWRLAVVWFGVGIANYAFAGVK